jgi:hypothetical protein
MSDKKGKRDCKSKNKSKRKRKREQQQQAQALRPYQTDCLIMSARRMRATRATLPNHRHCLVTIVIPLHPHHHGMSFV